MLRDGAAISPAVVARVVAAHRALQFREFADHVGDQIGLGEPRGRVGLAPLRRCAAIARAIPRARRARPAAELVVIDHLGEPRHAIGERLLAVLVEEELRVGQARAHHALVAFDDGARVGRAMLLTTRNPCSACPRRRQREILLVGLHREDEAFLRHREELVLEAARSTFGHSTRA